MKLKNKLKNNKLKILLLILITGLAVFCWNYLENKKFERFSREATSAYIESTHVFQNYVRKVVATKITDENKIDEIELKAAKCFSDKWFPAIEKSGFTKKEIIEIQRKYSRECFLDSVRGVKEFSDIFDKGEEK